MFYLKRTSAERRGMAMIDGPLSEPAALELLQAGDISRVQFSELGHSEWKPLDAHPAFLEVLVARGFASPPSDAPVERSSSHSIEPSGAWISETRLEGVPELTEADQLPDSLAPPSRSLIEGLPELTEADQLPDSLEPPAGADLEGLPELTDAHVLPDSFDPGPPGDPPLAAPRGFQAWKRPDFRDKEDAPGARKRVTTGREKLQSKPVITPKLQARKQWIVRALLASALMAILGGSFAAYRMFFSTAEPMLAGSIPSNSEVYVELLTLDRLAVGTRGTDMLSAANDDEKKLGSESVSVVRSALGIQSDDAAALILAANVLGFAGRKLGSQPEGALVLGFNRPGVVEDLLERVGVLPAGDFGNTGRLYRAPEAAIGVPGWQASTHIVWFRKHGLLVAGARSFIADIDGVVSLDNASLNENPEFAKAKATFSEGARLVTYFDASTLAQTTPRAAQVVLKHYFAPSERLSGNFRFVEAGTLLDLRGNISGVELPKTVPSAEALHMAQNLPVWTLAYVAYSESSLMTLRVAEEELLGGFKGHRAKVADGLEQMFRGADESLGVPLHSVTEALGKQTALAIVASDSLALGSLEADVTPTELAFLVVLALPDVEASTEANDRIGGALGSAFHGKGSVQRLGDGYKLTRNSGGPDLHFHFQEKYLLIAGGNPALTTKAVEWFAAKARPLSDDPAHARALQALPNAVHKLAWFDTARLASGLPKTNAETLPGEGNQADLELMGDRRLTTALAARISVENGTAVYRLSTLNAPAGLPLRAAVAAARAGAIADWSSAPEDLDALAYLGDTELEADLAQGSSKREHVFVEGDRVQVRWNGKWYTARITTVAGGRYRVAYDGYGAKWDELVSVDRIRRE